MFGSCSMITSSYARHTCRHIVYAAYESYESYVIVGISSISFRKILGSCPRAPLSQHPARTTDPDCPGLSQTSLQCTGWGNGVARQYAITPPTEHLHSAEVGEKLFFRLAYSLVVCTDARGFSKGYRTEQSQFQANHGKSDHNASC